MDFLNLNIYVFYWINLVRLDNKYSLCIYFFGIIMEFFGYKFIGVYFCYCFLMIYEWYMVY